MTEKKPMRAELVDDYRIKCQLLLEEVIDAEEAAKLAAAEIAELRAERDRLNAALERAQRDLDLLQALEEGGVDNWDFYADALDRADEIRAARRALGDAS